MVLHRNSAGKIPRSTLLWILWGPVLLIPTAFAVMATAVPIAFAAGGFWLGDVFLSFLRQFCHQMPSRSFWIWGYPFGLCIRCLAIYTTFAVVGFHLALGRSKPTRVPIALGLTLPMFLDVGLQWVELWNGNNWVRGSTGVLFAIGSASLLWTAISMAIRRMDVILAPFSGVMRLHVPPGRRER